VLITRNAGCVLYVMETAQKKKSFKNEIKGIQQTSLNISTSVADNVRFTTRWIR